MNLQLLKAATGQLQPQKLPRFFGLATDLVGDFFTVLALDKPISAHPVMNHSRMLGAIEAQEELELTGAQQ
jgi:hypothetical protein